MADFIESIGPSLEFCGYDGNNYYITPLGFREIAQYCLWYKYREYEEAKLIGADRQSLEEIRIKCRDSETLDFSNKEVISSITTPEGLVTLLHLSLKIKHPNIRKDQISLIVNLQHEQSQLIDSLLYVSGLKRKKGGEEDDSGETQAQLIL